MKTIGIIGGGASAVLAAMQLLDRSATVRVLIFDPRTELGCGIAYGTDDLAHLLNVPARAMSARPDQPEHFLNWLQSQSLWETEGGWQAHSFVPRRIYRDYLQSLIAPWMGGARLFHHRKSVSDIRETDTGAEISCNDGSLTLVDAVILANGNGAGPLGAPQNGASFWSVSNGFDLPAGASVAILGTGLSMIDSVMSLLRAGHKGPITAFSRRGLMPLSHVSPGLLGANDLHLPSELSPRRVMRWLRATVLARPDLDWRQVVDALRPHTQAIWSGWSLVEKRRFLRHARPHWDIRRHRMAPGVAAEITAAQKRGQLTILAARMIEGSSVEDRMITIRPRGGLDDIQISADHVIDCRGQAGPGGIDDNPLFEKMIARGQALPAEAGMGLKVDFDTNALINGLGARAKRIFVLGPPSLGSFWEIIAVPDIRVHAERLAKTLLV